MELYVNFDTIYIKIYQKSKKKVKFLKETFLRLVEKTKGQICSKMADLAALMPIHMYIFFVFI